MRPTITLLLALITTTTALAQFGQPIRSPEVDDQRRVTFRIRAPHAEQVLLTLEGVPEPQPLENIDGVWRLTTEPLEPDLYTYRFMVDGTPIPDPSGTLGNVYITGGGESIVEVSGDNPQPWTATNVPRGVLHAHAFRAGTFDDDSAFVVYTPPGYDPRAERRYPVLVLLHGVLNDAEGWTRAGRAHLVLDNLIAAQQAEPMLVVMPLGYGFANPREELGRLFNPQTDQRKLMESFQRLLLDEVLPRVERSYRVADGAAARAIAGLSMGGAQALFIGLNHPERFRHVASFSGAFMMFGNDRAELFADLDNADRPAQDLWIACGKADFVHAANVGLHRWFERKQVRHEFTETEGGHSWQVWRRNLATLAPKLFRD